VSTKTNDPDGDLGQERWML